MKWTQQDCIERARDYGIHCAMYLAKNSSPNPIMAGHFAEESAWWAFRAHPELREAA